MAQLLLLRRQQDKLDIPAGGGGGVGGWGVGGGATRVGLAGRSNCTESLRVWTALSDQ